MSSLEYSTFHSKDPRYQETKLDSIILFFYKVYDEYIVGIDTIDDEVYNEKYNNLLKKYNENIEYFDIVDNGPLKGSMVFITLNSKLPTFFKSIHKNKMLPFILNAERLMNMYLKEAESNDNMS